jgi:hypothetical protein
MFKAIAGMNQSVIATSSRPAARSSQTRTSGCTAGLSQARSVGIIGAQRTAGRDGSFLARGVEEVPPVGHGHGRCSRDRRGLT